MVAPPWITLLAITMAPSLVAVHLACESLRRGESSCALAAGVNVILAVSLNIVNGMTGQFSIGHAGFMAVGAYTTALTLGKFSDHSVTSQWTVVVALIVAVVATAIVGGAVGAVATSVAAFLLYNFLFTAARFTFS